MNKEELLRIFKIKLREVKENIHNDYSIENLENIQKIKNINVIEAEYFNIDSECSYEKFKRINSFADRFKNKLQEIINSDYNNIDLNSYLNKGEQNIKIKLENYIDSELIQIIIAVIILSEDIYNLADYFITPNLIDSLKNIIRLKSIQFKHEENNRILHETIVKQDKIKIEKCYLDILEILNEESKNLEIFLLSLPNQISKTFYHTLLESPSFERFNKLCILLEGYFALIFNVRVNNEKDLESMQNFFSKIENKVECKITLGDWTDSIFKLNEKKHFIDQEIINFIRLFNLDIRNNIKGHGCFSNLNSNNYNYLEINLIKNAEKLRDLNISLKIYNLQYKKEEVSFIHYENTEYEHKPINFEKLGFCLINKDLILTFKGINLNNEIEYYNFSNQLYRHKFNINYEKYKNIIFENFKIENYEKKILDEKENNLKNFKKKLGKELFLLDSKDIKTEFEINSNLKIKIEKEKDEIFTIYRLKNGNEYIKDNEVILNSCFKINEDESQKKLKKFLFSLEEVIKTKDKENIFKNYIEVIKKDIKNIKIIFNLE